jgi:hypothetical protein
MFCPNCSAGKIVVISRRPAKWPGRTEDVHFDGRCRECGVRLWRHGPDEQRDSIVWLLGDTNARCRQTGCS